MESKNFHFFNKINFRGEQVTCNVSVERCQGVADPETISWC